MNAIYFAIQCAAAGVVVGMVLRILKQIVAEVWHHVMNAVIRELDRRRPKEPTVLINGEPTNFDRAIILRGDND